VATYDEEKIASLLSDAGIIRNRAKILATIGNAQAFLKVQEEFSTFDTYIWGFVDGRPIQNTWRTMSQIPAQSDKAVVLSKDLIRRGFRFVGPTIVYAHMQATGMVNDHTVDCFRYQALNDEFQKQ
jgi:DNA-3-methyladenine glycosylase I